MVGELFFFLFSLRQKRNARFVAETSHVLIVAFGGVVPADADVASVSDVQDASRVGGA